MHFLHFFLFQYESVLSFNYNSNINLFSFLISVVSFLLSSLPYFIEWKLRKGRKKIFLLFNGCQERDWFIQRNAGSFFIPFIHLTHHHMYIYFTYVVYYCKSICIDWNERNVLLCNFNPAKTYDFYEFTYWCYAEMLLLCLSWK